MNQPTDGRGALDAAARISPFCAALRSKKYYFLEGPPRAEADLLDGSHRCWCLRTMQAVGPDGELVEPGACGRQRACFERWGAAPT